MTLKTSVLSVLFVLSVVSAPAADSIPAIRWDIETTRPAPYTLSLYHGETVYLEPEYLCLNNPLTFSNVTAVALQYRSTDMAEGTYYQVTGTVQSASEGRLQIPWTPAAEGTNTTYTYNIVVTSSNGMSPRAFGTIRLSGIVSGTSTSAPSILPHYAGTLIITNNGVAGQVVVCTGGSSSNTQLGIWSSVAGTGDMLADVYDPIHGNKQVAFADELPGQSNNVLALAQTRIDGSSNSVLAIVQTRLDGSSNSVLALAQQSVSVASNALHTAITGETARAQAAEAGALHTNGDNSASTVLPLLGLSISTNSQANTNTLIVTGMANQQNGTYVLSGASYVLQNPESFPASIYWNPVYGGGAYALEIDGGGDAFVQTVGAAVVGQWPTLGAPFVTFGDQVVTNTAQSVTTLARAALTTSGFTMGGAINMGGNNISGVGTLASSGNTASGAAAVALGAGASATHNNTFIWSDGTPTSSSAANQATITASGGIRLQANTTNTGNLAVGGTISGSGPAITSLNGTNITAGTVSTNALDASSRALFAVPVQTNETRAVFIGTLRANTPVVSNDVATLAYVLSVNPSISAGEIRVRQVNTNEYASLSKSQSNSIARLSNKVIVPGGSALYASGYAGTQYGQVGQSATLLNGATAVTYSAWVLISNVVANAGVIVDRGGTGNAKINGITTHSDGLSPIMYVSDGTNSPSAGATTAAPTNTWIHWCGVWDNVSASIGMYTNGVLSGVMAQGALTNGVIAQDDYLQLGYDDWSAAFKLKGRVDEIAIWKRRLTTSEIGELAAGRWVATNLNFAAGTAMSNNLSLLLHCDDNSGTTLTDTSGSGQNGSLGTGTWVPGKALPHDSTEVTVLSSSDGIADGEQGLALLGNGFGRVVLDGTTVRLNVSGTEKIRLDSTGLNLNGMTVSNATFAGSGSGLTGVPSATVAGTASNLVLSTNLNVNGKYISGTGDNSGLYVNSTGNMFLNTNALPNATNMAPGFVTLTVVPNTNTYQCINMYSVRNPANNTSGNYLRGATANGTLHSPTSTVADSVLISIVGTLCATNTWETGSSGGLVLLANTDANSTNRSTYWKFTTVQNNNTTQAERMRLQHDGSIKLFDMSTSPATPSGGALIFATNGEMKVMDASGNITQISPHNDHGEMILDSVNEFSGQHETLNVTLLGKYIEESLPKESPYKGKIYSVLTNAVSKDWSAHEATIEAERNAEIQKWKPDADIAQPTPYIKRPQPIWIKETQETMRAE